MNPKVSIVIPIYNVEAYVAECIASVLNQTYTNWEALCIDDASTDASLAYAQQATSQDNRFSFIQHSENKGLSVARNTGLEHATGTYIMFLDSDDMLEPYALERLVSIVQENNLDVLDFNARAIFEGNIDSDTRKEAEYLIRPHVEGVHTGPELFTIYWQQKSYKSPAPFHFIKRELLKNTQLQFQPGILHEDELFSPLLHAYAHRTMFINEALYIYRIRSASIVTKQRGIRNVAGIFAVTEALHEWLQQNAQSYSNYFIDAFTQNIWVLRNTMARDILQCTGEELVAFETSLTPAQRANFYEQGIQLAASLQEQESSHTWKLANALGKLPHGFSRLASKRS